MRALYIAFVITAVGCAACSGAQGQGAPMQLSPPPATRTAPPAKATTAPAQVDPGAVRPSIERVNAYFNALAGMTADFTQTGPDGRGGLALSEESSPHRTARPAGR